MSQFLETVIGEYNRMRARAFASDGYEGVTHAGLAIVGTVEPGLGLVLVAKRAYDETDDPEVRETWEFPGGGLEDGEEPLSAAFREYAQEVGLPLPQGTVVNGWRAGPEDNYQGFVYAVDEVFDLTAFVPNDEVQALAWIPLKAPRGMTLRPEMADFDWSLLDAAVVSGDEESDMDDELAGVTDLVSEEPVLTALDLIGGPIPVHGVLAPEGVESGDGRGFNSGAMTTRPLRLPFMWQEQQTSGHDGAFVIGSVDRLMRKDGLIHWEGSMLTTPKASDFIEMLVHFEKFGVSVDGDKGVRDEKTSAERNGLWFGGVRASGLTAVAIPAFAEAYVALGPHPEMPAEVDPSTEVLAASGLVKGDIIGASTFDRGPGWVTNPVDTKRLHDYWTKPGQEGYRKVNWGVGGDYRRCVVLVGEKIATNSPTDMRYIKQICAQWHYDALGYWPGDLGKPGNNPITESLSNPDLVATDEGWEAVLVSSVSGNSVRPPVDYFHRPAGEFGALTIEDADENGFRRTYGYAAQWGVCHIGMNGQCTEPPRTYSDDYPAFHLGRTKVEGNGYIYTGVLTYGVGHRDAETILSESPEQAYFDNVNNAWAAVRVGEDETGIWFSGVVLPGVPEEHVVKIEASGQVSGEWLRGAMRACLTVNVPGFPVQRPSAEYDEFGNVVALAASAFGQITDAPCEPTPAERMAALASAHAEVEMARLREQFNWTDVAEELVVEAEDEGRVKPVGLREDGAIVYEKDGEVPGTDTIVAPMPEED